MATVFDPTSPLSGRPSYVGGWGTIPDPRQRSMVSGRGERPTNRGSLQSGMGEKPGGNTNGLSNLLAIVTPPTPEPPPPTGEAAAVKTRETTGRTKNYGGVVYSDNSAGRRARAGQAMAGMAAYSLLG